MSESLPFFRYHPDPISTGSIVLSDSTCKCCELARGYIYSASVYAIEDLHDSLCPWCIASGLAALKFDASFSDDHPLISSGISISIVDEVSFRTPGFFSWQQEIWLTHCEDACEFHGHATTDDVLNASLETIQEWIDDHEQDEKAWKWISETYVPRGHVALHKFRCRHCGLVKLGLDAS